jgi:hypothetical protein
LYIRRPPYSRRGDDKIEAPWFFSPRDLASCLQHQNDERGRRDMARDSASQDVRVKPLKHSRKCSLNYKDIRRAVLFWFPPRYISDKHWAQTHLSDDRERLASNPSV